MDVLPTSDDSIGFSTKWYPEGFTNSIDYKIDESCTIKILKAPYFIATKLEAFKDRGNNDGRTSKDFEDIVYILENRTSIWEELINADEEVKVYLLSQFKNLLSNPFIEEWIDGHVERGVQPATDFILNQIEKFII